MQIHTPIGTPLGIMHGRDCIFLDNVAFENGTNTLVLAGEVNGNLCSPVRQEDISYRLRFTGVLALKIVELDSWDFAGESCFDEILKSEWVRALGGKVTQSHRHFLFQTYDDVFEVVCKDYEFMLCNHPA